MKPYAAGARTYISCIEILHHSLQYIMECMICILASHLTVHGFAIKLSNIHMLDF
jgi:hypothetical protein